MIYFTSDLHFDHQNIIHFCNRPFDSVQEMNDALIDNWNSVVAPDDTVYLLGDGCMGKREDSLKYIEELNGHIIWILGNHDYPHPINLPHIVAKWRPIYEQYATIADNIVGLEEFVLCHFPYWDVSRHDGRYTAWLPDYNGKWLLHGHLHSMDAWDPERPHCYDVGVDAHNYTPVSIDKIREDIKLYSALEEKVTAWKNTNGKAVNKS